MNESPCIGDIVEIPPVKTVIRLEEGRMESGEIAGSFVFTTEVFSHCTVISDSLLGHQGQGYFLQGDFGSGKSHFLAALYAWLVGIAGAEVLAGRHGGLKRVGDSGKRFLPVAISLVNYRAETSLEQIVVEAVEKSLRSKGIEAVLTPVSSFLNHLKSLLGEPEAAESFIKLLGISTDRNKSDVIPTDGTQAKKLDTDNLTLWIDEHPHEAYIYGMRLMKSMGLKIPGALVEERHETFSRMLSAVKNAGFDGLFLLIDELSEFFRSKGTAQELNEDARTLQLIGELTADEPLWIIAAVQESIESTGDISQVTFRKIKDRFPVKLSLSTVHIRSLISQRLVRRKPGADEAIYRIYEAFKRQFSTFSWTYDSFRQTYPVHPATIALLDGLGDLFSEHRGIVDFIYSRLAGDKSRNIRGILQQPATEVLAPDSIYDHFASRLAEFSAFNVYPRHVVPHLDKVIDDVIEDADDRNLARRLVRILVLYKIHPTADTPPVGQLAEIAACSLDFQMPGFNARFIAEALLDPIVEASRFLIKRPSESGNPFDTVYTVITQDDPSKILKARISRTARDLEEDDSRLLSEPFSDIPESEAWPGVYLWEKGVIRQITWHFSIRRVFIRFLSDDDVFDRLSHEISSAKYDFAVVITFGGREYSADYTATWQIPFPKEKMPLFKEFLATRLVSSELKPSNPADAPLIQPAKESLERLRPAVHQAAMEAFYSGNFTDPQIQVGAAVRQVKRFDRLLEAAGEIILDDRYPKFREIAPRRIHPSPRLYQRLLDEVIAPGSILLREAQAKGLVEAIDGLAVPLGLARLKGGSYVFSPDMTGHPFLSFFSGLLKPAGPASIEEIAQALQTGVYGLPEDTFLFLLSALACGGLITLLKNGRIIPVNFLHFISAEKADEVALGELINQNDRETLKTECGFLAPPSTWDSFGLRQQREAWKAVIKFKETASTLPLEIQSQLSQVAEFSAFKVFNLSAIDQKINSLTNLANEIKISCSAKEGLERFLKTWRGTGLKNEDIQFLNKLMAFLLRNAEQFVFIHHYIHHSAVEKAARQDKELAELRKTVISLVEKPERFIINDEGKQLSSAFSHFREFYLAFYSKRHAAYYRSFQKPSLSKSAERAVFTLERLAAIEALDRPPGMEQFLRDLKTPGKEQCRRNISEELTRSPYCTCGYQPGDMEAMPEPAEKIEPEEAINRFFMEYVDIIKNPGVLESITAHSYAVKDADPDMSHRLKQIGKIVQEDTITPAHLLTVFDEQTTFQLSRALAGKVQIQHKKLSELISRLAGRRLTQSQIRKIVDEWTSTTDEKTLLAIEEDREQRPSTATVSGSLDWWPMLHDGIFAREFQPEPMPREETAELENRLEKRFPSVRLKGTLQLIDTQSLLRFITRERYHTVAVRAAWNLLSERILTGAVLPGEGDIRSSHADHDTADDIRHHLEILKTIAERLDQQYPARLSMRVFAQELMNDAGAAEYQQVTLIEVT